MGRFSSFWTLIIFGIFLILLVFVSPLTRQSREDIEWLKFIGRTSRDIAYDIARLNDGSFVIAGWTGSKENFDQDVLLLGMDKGGKLLWEKEFGGTGTDGAVSLTPASDGGFVVLALSDSDSGELSAQFGEQDIWLLKFDNKGTLQWKKCYGTYGYETAFDVIEDEGYIFAGSINIDGQEDFWVVKVDKSGDVVWSRNFGGTDWDAAFSIAKSKNGYIVAGMSKSADGDVKINHGSADMWIAEISTDGRLLWENAFGGSEWDQIVDLTAVEDGYIAAGVSWSEEIVGKERKADFVMIKFDINGKVQFFRTYGGSSDDIVQKILVTEDGYVLAGTSWSDDGDVAGKHEGSDYWLIKVDKDGELIWQKCFGGDMDEVAYALENSKSGFLIGGISYSYVAGIAGRSHGGGDVFIVKTK